MIVTLNQRLIIDPKELSKGHKGGKSLFTKCYQIIIIILLVMDQYLLVVFVSGCPLVPSHSVMIPLCLLHFHYSVIVVLILLANISLYI